MEGDNDERVVYCHAVNAEKGIALLQKLLLFFLFRLKTGKDFNKLSLNA